MRRLALLAALLLLTACGGGAHKESASRTAVRAYLTRVDNTELLLQQPLHNLSVATKAFSQTPNMPATVTMLAASQRTLLNLFGQLVLVTPPPPAKKLHALLLELVQKQATLAGELRAFAVFNPAFGATLKPLVAANATARKALQGNKKAALVAAGIHVYRASIDAVVIRLRRLRPPAVERPLYDAQLNRLVELDSTLVRLEQAVRARDLTALARAQHAVSVASVSSDSRANQVAERTAVLAYNAQVAAVQTLSRLVLQEHDRLQVTVR